MDNFAMWSSPSELMDGMSNDGLQMETLVELQDNGFEPQTRARSNTWPLPRPENFVEPCDESESNKCSNQQLSGGFLSGTLTMDLQRCDLVDILKAFIISQLRMSHRRLGGARSSTPSGRLCQWPQFYCWTVAVRKIKEIIGIINYPRVIFTPTKFRDAIAVFFTFAFSNDKLPMVKL